MNIQITPANVCSLLVDDYSTYGDHILTHNLDILEAGIILLNSTFNSDDIVLLLNIGNIIKNYFNNNDINTIATITPHTDMWLRIMDNNFNLSWQTMIKSLPQSLQYRINLMDIYNGGKHIDYFRPKDSLNHFNNILNNTNSLLEKNQGLYCNDYDNYYSNSPLDYYKLRDAFCNLVYSYVPFTDFRLSTIRDIVAPIKNSHPIWSELKNRGSLTITAERLTILLYELTYYKYAIQWYSEGHKDYIENLSLPPQVTLDTFNQAQLLDCLEYNYSDKCPPGFFKQLNTCMTLMDLTEPTIQVLQSAYNATVLANSYIADTNNILPEFV